MRREADGGKRGNHRLFIGPFQPELEEGFLAFLKRKKEMDPLAPLVVLVGSNLLGLYLRRFLVLRGLNYINIRFLTLIDFAKALAFEPLHRDGLRPLWRIAIYSAPRRIDSPVIAPPL